MGVFAPSCLFARGQMFRSADCALAVFVKAALKSVLPESHGGAITRIVTIVLIRDWLGLLLCSFLMSPDSGGRCALVASAAAGSGEALLCGAHSERAWRPLPRCVSHQWLRFIAALSKEVILPDYDTENEVSLLHGSSLVCALRNRRLLTVTRQPYSIGTL
ncbi:hypothetical protein HPB50_021732 [Hyalomma asiaticum]|uniref:Uncharacterized protein n=1 Tax=Hyalomma asiaticum TaxID=266040 RepID=A0ACB7TLA9_HYAAI|nr:hypothetical protein HPB50_021732 [Hyalomma asiaticum]